MRAYKVLNNGRSEFTGLAWPLPGEGEAGRWVRASGPIGLCVNGIHASTVDQLPQWLGAEIWEIELSGQILRTEPALVAEQGRLIAHIDEWGEDARIDFSRDCAGRARGIAARYPAGEPILTGKIEPFAERGNAPAVGYWTALLTGESATGRRAGPDYDVAFARERAHQAQWLRRELRLRD
jgi:hypothetical protein